LDFNWQTNIWRLHTSPKVKHFLWKAMKSALPLGEALARRNIIADLNCKRCGRPETSLHLLLLCPFAKKVWDLAPVLFKRRRDPLEVLKSLFLNLNFQDLGHISVYIFLYKSYLLKRACDACLICTNNLIYMFPFLNHSPTSTILTALEKVGLSSF